MNLSVPLTSEEEAKLLAEAEAQGVTPEVLVRPGTGAADCGER